MKIGVDARCLEWTRGGPARYVVQMLKHWPVQRPDHRFVLYFQHGVPDEPFLRHPAFEPVVLGGPRLLTRRRIVSENTLLPLALRRTRPDILFAPWYSAPLVTFGVPTVIGAWDITCNTHPSHYTWPDLIGFGMLMPPTCRAAAGLLTCSNFDAAQIERYFGIPRSRMCVVPYAADDVFAPSADAARSTAFRQKYGLTGRYLLSMGIIIKRRNVDVVIEAFKRLRHRHPDVSLVVVGRNVTVPFVDVDALMRPLEEEGRGLRLVRAPEDELVDFYREAEYYVCTSTVDGESLMLKEAMRSGTPVVTSPLLEETVGGNAVILDDPTSVERTVAVLDAVLSQPAARPERAAAAHLFASGLSWSEVAAKSLAFIESRAGQVVR